MARYYEETALIEFVKQYTPHINGETTMECVERAIREAPTADVAPRAEVARLIDGFQRSIRADAKVGMSAGEILLHINNMLAELKKKYTEDKNG